MYTYVGRRRHKRRWGGGKSVVCALHGTNTKHTREALTGGALSHLFYCAAVKKYKKKTKRSEETYL